MTNVTMTKTADLKPNPWKKLSDKQQQAVARNIDGRPLRPTEIRKTLTNG